jgi:hypothetical protein
MTNTEIKKLISILKQEGCNSKKQAIEYLEKRLEPVKLSEILAKIKEVFKKSYFNPKYNELSNGSYWLVLFENNKIERVSNSLWEYRFEEIRKGIDEEDANIPLQQCKVSQLNKYLFLLWVNRVEIINDLEVEKIKKKGDEKTMAKDDKEGKINERK